MCFERVGQDMSQGLWPQSFYYRGLDSCVLHEGWGPVCTFPTLFSERMYLKTNKNLARGTISTKSDPDDGSLGGDAR